ncbi:unnamed protein product [Caenorhabditis bovis]|uniref:Uncharacterized protein n=1 Tax=Caenorhabditis bovis TaxID=2654633 RepID=A0A8S1EW82_9PELO|nr:unnamed protein product [Caenorhabditis bovis]
MTHSDFKYLLFLAILVQIPSAKCLACYACMAINYRQNVLSRNDELLPPQSRENLSLVIDSLIEHDFGLVAVSSSCADVALTSQPSFLNSPISICAPDDRCAKMDFVFKEIRIQWIYQSELIFSIILLVCALNEFFINARLPLSLLMSIGCVLFFLLYIEFYFGFTYNW